MSNQPSYDALGFLVSPEEPWPCAQVPAGAPVCIGELRQCLEFDPVSNMPRFKHSPTLQSDEANDERAGIGAAVAMHFADLMFDGGDVEDFGTVVGDLLSCLMHFADRVGVPFDTLVARGRWHHDRNVLGAS